MGVDVSEMLMVGKRAERGIVMVGELVSLVRSSLVIVDRSAGMVSNAQL